MIDPGLILCQTSTASFSGFFFKVWKCCFLSLLDLSRFRLCLWGNVEDEVWDEVSKGFFEYWKVFVVMMWFVVWVNGYVFAEGSFGIVSNYWNNELSTSPVFNQ